LLTWVPLLTLSLTIPSLSRSSGVREGGDRGVETWRAWRGVETWGAGLTWGSETSGGGETWRAGETWRVATWEGGAWRGVETWGAGETWRAATWEGGAWRGVETWGDGLTWGSETSGGIFFISSSSVFLGFLFGNFFFNFQEKNPPAAKIAAAPNVTPTIRPTGLFMLGLGFELTIEVLLTVELQKLNGFHAYVALPLIDKLQPRDVEQELLVLLFANVPVIKIKTIIKIQ